MTTIAITLNSAWNIYNFRLGLAKALLAKGYRVLAIAPPDGRVGEIEAVGCVFIPLTELSRQGTNPWNDLRLLWTIYRIYKREKVDLALQYTIKSVIYGSLAAWMAGTKSINTLTGLGYAFLSDGLINRMVKKLYRFALRFADRVWFQNPDDRALFLGESLVKAEKTAIVNGSGIDVAKFTPLPKEKKEEHFHFLFIGRLLTDKGIHELLAAMEALIKLSSKARLHIVGAVDEGNPTSLTQFQVDEWKGQESIVYHGTAADVRPYIQAADVMVLPSYREGLPRVMLEGLAMARPLIATDVSGCRETIEEGENGFLVPMKNASALAEAMQRMINLSPEVLQQMGQRGRKMAEQRFAEHLIIKQYLTVINELLDR